MTPERKQEIIQYCNEHENMLFTDIAAIFNETTSDVSALYSRYISSSEPKQKSLDNSVFKV